MITIKKDGTILPWGIKVYRITNWPVIAPTEENTEEIEGADIEYDYGSTLGTKNPVLYCITPNLNRSALLLLMSTLMGQLDQLLKQEDLLVKEADTGKGVYFRLASVPGVEDCREMFEIEIPLILQPAFIALAEKNHVGSGTLINEGNFEAPVKISIQGPVVNPQVTIGGELMQYTGNLAAPDILEIDTRYKTAKLNEQNALKYFTGAFPQLQPGTTQVTAAAEGTTTFTWRDCWI